MILLLDNYDSFTYNLAQYLGQMKQEVDVRRNDRITIELITRFAGKIPILGVCLGHQAIGAAFGGHVIRAPQLMHGKTSEIQHDGKTIFEGLPNPFPATRYHSLIVERDRKS